MKSIKETCLGNLQRPLHLFPLAFYFILEIATFSTSQFNLKGLPIFLNA